MLVSKYCALHHERFWLSRYLRTGCPKSLGHFLRTHVSKTIASNVNLKACLERKKSENYFDSKLDPTPVHNNTS